ncbi:hypothetical protein FFLO_06324 [Filobasidium floriforme]|uniref:Defect at low temperature protein 1 n=1 Tax=Filobasidium floriforme TaxID=5210 RepID=A0A8K0JF45_9TREE|nr:uncharacterized protein HD553DRAFT_317334 [Filobasidium floriforme]KAG7528235.1 hypothetical protein FFLO_06324 [Filobasidium floriforme]KAH8080085.1 hypothetical protein HD553DRAFT_317334 [Filobasidium floriforme]
MRRLTPTQSFNTTIKTWLVHRPSFWVSVFCQLCLGVAVAAFVSTFAQQAFKGVAKRWNIVIIVGLTVGVLVCSVVLILGRLYHVRRVFQSIPKPYIPIKAIDVPNVVAKHIMTEYNRTAVIAHLSQPTSTHQEGWGQPETQFGGIYFRERIRAMYTVILESLDSLTPTSNKPSHRDRRLPKDSFTHLTAHPALPETVKPLLKVFLKQLEAARYARSEPNEKEFENCMKVVALMLGIFDVQRAKSGQPYTPS